MPYHEIYLREHFTEVLKNSMAVHLIRGDNRIVKTL